MVALSQFFERIMKYEPEQNLTGKFFKVKTQANCLGFLVVASIKTYGN